MPDDTPKDPGAESTLPIDPKARPLPIERVPELTGYEIIEKIGAGGQGVVYRARHKGLKRTVAIKVMQRRLDVSEEAANRFLREARTAARLTHSGIVPVFDSGQEGEFLYFAMDLVEGKPLKPICKRERAFTGGENRAIPQGL